jgi:hypothetical protein
MGRDQKASSTFHALNAAGSEYGLRELVAKGPPVLGSS